MSNVRTPPVPRRSARALLGILLAVVCAATMAAPASAADAAGRAHRTTVLADCVHHRVEPRTVIIACGDGNWYLRVRHYRFWHRDAALGRGTVWINDCTPDCARGHFRHFAARIRFVDPVRTGHGLVFSAARVTYLANGRHQRISLETRPLRTTAS